MVSDSNFILKICSNFCNCITRTYFLVFNNMSLLSFKLTMTTCSIKTLLTAIWLLLITLFKASNAKYPIIATYFRFLLKKLPTPPYQRPKYLLVIILKTKQYFSGLHNHNYIFCSWMCIWAELVRQSLCLPQDLLSGLTW